MHVCTHFCARHIEVSAKVWGNVLVHASACPSHRCLRISACAQIHVACWNVCVHISSGRPVLIQIPQVVLSCTWISFESLRCVCIPMAASSMAQDLCMICTVLQGQRRMSMGNKCCESQPVWNEWNDSELNSELCRLHQRPKCTVSLSGWPNQLLYIVLFVSILWV